MSTPRFWRSRRKEPWGASQEYEAAPAVKHRDCAASGCRACLDVCPHDAIRIEDGRIAHDTNVCELCGRCVAACPTGATVNPAFTEPMLEGMCAQFWQGRVTGRGE